MCGGQSKCSQILSAKVAIRCPHMSKNKIQHLLSFQFCYGRTENRESAASWKTLLWNLCTTNLLGSERDLDPTFTIPAHCYPFFLHAPCPSACLPGTFGMNCARICQCPGVNHDCHPVTGDCICAPGYHGSNCRQSEFALNYLQRDLLA